MKKTFIIIFFLVLSTAVQAQLVRSFGLKLGGTASYQDWKHYSSGYAGSYDTDTKNGFNIGAFAEFFHHPFMSMVAEVNYVEKGTQREIPAATIRGPLVPGEKQTWTFGINYLNFTFLAKARMDGIICTPYLVAGPKLDIELNKTSGYKDISFYKDFSKTRLGFKAGVGTEIKLFGINFLAEALWDTDFGNLYDGETTKITASAVDFRGGFSINLK